MKVFLAFDGTRGENFFLGVFDNLAQAKGCAEAAVDDERGPRTQHDYSFICVEAYLVGGTERCGYWWSNDRGANWINAFEND